MVLEESVEVISFGGSSQKRVLSGFGVEKAAYGIEHTEIQSENIHNTCVLRVWGWNFVTFLRCNRRTRSRVRVARFDSKGSHPKPGLTWIRSSLGEQMAFPDAEKLIVTKEKLCD